MVRKISIKRYLVFILMFIFLISFSGATALAAQTKVVNVSVPASCISPPTSFSNTLQAISRTTYNYDDGTYKGTLSCVGFSNINWTYYNPQQDGSLLFFTFNILYSGTVTTY